MSLAVKKQQNPQKKKIIRERERDRNKISFKCDTLPSSHPETLIMNEFYEHSRDFRK